MMSSPSSSLVTQTADELIIRHPDSARRSVLLRYTFLFAVVAFTLGVALASFQSVAFGAVCAGGALLLVYFTATFSHPYSYTVTPTAVLLEQHSLWRKKVHELQRAHLSGLWLAIDQPEHFRLYVCHSPDGEGSTAYRCIAIFWDKWTAARKVADQASATLNLPWQLSLIIPAEPTAPKKVRDSRPARPQPKGSRPAGGLTPDSRRPSRSGLDPALSRFQPLQGPKVWVFDRAQAKVSYQTRIAGITEYPLEDVTDFEIEPEVEGKRAQGESEFKYAYQILLVLHSGKCLLVKKCLSSQPARTLTSQAHHEARWTVDFLREWLAGRK
jgi:hypothetical protein